MMARAGSRVADHQGGENRNAARHGQRDAEER
jgi:hypothetical protein